MESHITWGIYVKGVNQADLTEKDKLCRRVARMILGITDEPVEVWQDTYIKPAADRPGRDAMLRAAHQGDFSILVTPAPHHISRDIYEYVRITRTLIENGIVIHFADGTTQDCHETERPLYTIYRRVSSAAQGVDTKTDRKAFRRVQERLERARRKQNTPSGSARRGTDGHDTPLLRDLLRCGVCDEPMDIISAKGRRFYRCRNSIPGVDMPALCDARIIGTEALDQEVWTQVREMVNDPAAALETHPEEDKPTTEVERRIAEYCHRMAPDLETLDPKGKRELLLALGITATAEMAEDSTRITVRFAPPSDGTPAPAY